MRIINARIILPSGISDGKSIVIDSGRIKSIGGVHAPSGAETIDAKGFFVTPGFIDSHIHGDPATVLAHEVKYGTTSVVSAISCLSNKNIARAISAIKRFKADSVLGDSVLGVRFEGPFISREKAGAQDKRFIRTPSTRELRGIIKRCGPLLKIVTLAPELKGASKLIRILTKNGIVSSMGHTNANYKEGIKGINSGVTHATHLFNGMRRLNGDKNSGAVACLDDKRVRVEIIMDLIHVRPELLRLSLASKSRDDIILITDSVRAEAGDRKAEGGVYRLRDGTIAGSCLTMIGAIKNAVRTCGVELKDAVKFATINPARLLGVDDFKGSIAKGKDADLVIFDKDFDVKMTMVHGKIVYKKRGF